MSLEEDPLDLFEDDGDGVIETILLSEEDDEKNIQTRTGCSLILLVTGASAIWFLWGFDKFIS